MSSTKMKSTFGFREERELPQRKMEEKRQKNIRNTDLERLLKRLG